MTCVTFLLPLPWRRRMLHCIAFFRTNAFHSRSQQRTSNRNRYQTKPKRHSNDYYWCLVGCLSVGLCKTSGPFAISRITVNNVLNLSVCRFLLSKFECFYSASGHINSVFKEQKRNQQNPYQLLFNPNLVFDLSMRCVTHKGTYLNYDSSLHWFHVYIVEWPLDLFNWHIVHLLFELSNHQTCKPELFVSFLSVQSIFVVCFWIWKLVACISSKERKKETITIRKVVYIALSSPVEQ